MANNMVGIRAEARQELKNLARRKRVSQQGLITALVMMAAGKESDLGIIDLDWEKIRKLYPNTASRNRKTWSVVVKAVDALLDEFDTAEEIAMHTRFTIAQVERAMKELEGE